MRGVAAAAALALLLACAGPVTPAQVTVEFAGGFPRAPGGPTGPPRLVLLLDATLSMTSATPEGPTRLEAARIAADRLIGGLSPGTELAVHLLGAGGACGTAVPVAVGELPGREAERRAIRAAPSRGEGSLAEALSRLGDDAAGGRVVAFTDFDTACGGDLCDAVATLVGRGAVVDLVRLGTQPAPQCIESLLAPAGPPDRLAGLAAAPPTFRIERADPGAASSERGVRGRADGVPARILPGRATLTVELEPPLVIDLALDPGVVTRVQVLDFPGLDPPVREWRVVREPAPPARPPERGPDA